MTGKAEGSVTVKATARDGCGASTTKTITVVAASTPVTSVSITGTASSVNVGSSITLTATTSPTDADNRGVTWSVESGSSYVTISGSTTSTGGSCTVTGKAAGTAVIKATAADGSGKTDTYSVTVNAPQYTSTLKYNANGGSGAPSTQTYTGTSTSSHTFTISSTEPTRSGYTFLGWATSASATSASYDPGDTISVGYKSTRTLYAVWEHTITLSFSANSGTGAPSKQTWTGVGSHTFTISTTEPTRSGWTFLGWGTSSSGSTYQYDPGDTITLSASDTLYAKWSKTITLTYSANGGSGAPSSESKTIYSGSTYATFTIPSTTPTRSGYTFLGWSTSSTATSATYTSGNTYSPSSSNTLYAVWKSNSVTYTLSFNVNGGSGSVSSLTGSSSTGSCSFTIPSTKPTRTGWTFAGWATSASATSASYQPGGTYTTSSTSSTLYAVWTHTITLSYNDNGGSNQPSSQSWTGTSASHTFTLTTATPTRSGYNFAGWATSASATSAEYQPGGTISLTASTTLYAVWTHTVTLTFNANGGSGAPSADSWTGVGSHSFSIPTSTPTRSGYTFVGWSTSSSATSASYLAGGSISISASTTLYAVWSHTIAVTFDANGGTGAPSGLTWTGVGSHTFTIPSNEPTRSGYNFVGWATTSGATSAQYQPGGSAALSDSVTLYAVWQAGEIVITSTQANTSMVAGNTFSYTLTTNITGCAVSVSGASWLSVDGMTVSGLATAVGAYHVTVTVSHDGFEDVTQSFTISVYSALGFISEPEASGIYAYVLDTEPESYVLGARAAAPASLDGDVSADGGSAVAGGSAIGAMAVFATLFAVLSVFFMRGAI